MLTLFLIIAAVCGGLALTWYKAASEYRSELELERNLHGTTRELLTLNRETLLDCQRYFYLAISLELGHLSTNVSAEFPMWVPQPEESYSAPYGTGHTVAWRMYMEPGATSCIAEVIEHVKLRPDGTIDQRYWDAWVMFGEETDDDMQTFTRCVDAVAWADKHAKEAYGIKG
jgi:hypothetical protein